MPEVWTPVEAALDRAARDGRAVDVWLRDDDAVTVTPALERLTRLSRDTAMPVLLAVIPEPADHELARHVAHEPLLTPTQHGFDHTNHAAPGQRACELDGNRPLDIMLDALARGRERLGTLFGTRCTDILVPPWNRIAPALLPRLSGLGFGALSTFGTLHSGNADLDVVNCDVDIIDWRHGRVCRPEAKLIGWLADVIDTGAPVGFLTHHLVHDEAAWRFLDDALGYLASRPEVRFTTADRLRTSM